MQRSVVGHELTLAKELPKQIKRMAGAVKKIYAALEKCVPPEQTKSFKNQMRIAKKDCSEFWKAFAVIAKNKQQIIERTMRIAAKRPRAEALEFYKGMTEAHERPMYREDGGLTAANSTFVVYMWLVMNWKTVEKFHSIPELHKWVCAWLPGLVADEETFGRMCRRLKIHLGKSGRPPKKKRT